MKLLLAGFISVLATAAFAQPDNKPANAMDLAAHKQTFRGRTVVPAGGCMPIGLTARGTWFFQCSAANSLSASVARPSGRINGRYQSRDLSRSRRRR